MVAESYGRSEGRPALVDPLQSIETRILQRLLLVKWDLRGRKSIARRFTYADTVVRSGPRSGRNRRVSRARVTVASVLLGGVLDQQTRPAYLLLLIERCRKPSSARSGWPTAVRNNTLFPAACGEKNVVTSSSKNVKPVAPKCWAYAAK